MSWDNHGGIQLTGISASVLIISDSLFSGQRDISEDVSGGLAIESLSDFGFENINLDYYPDELAAIKGKIENDVSEKIGLILLIGGTGLSRRDVTTDAAEELVKKSIPGFGEEFRRRSIDEVAEMGLLSRAMAGIRDESLIIALPGSPNAVKTGIDIIGKIIGHIMELIRV